MKDAGKPVTFRRAVPLPGSSPAITAAAVNGAPRCASISEN